MDSVAHNAVIEAVRNEIEKMILAYKRVNGTPPTLKQITEWTKLVIIDYGFNYE